MLLPSFFVDNNAWIQYYSGPGISSPSCHMHDMVELLLVLQNNLIAENTGVKIHITAPAVIIHNRYSMHKTYYENDHVYERYLFDIKEDMIDTASSPEFLNSNMTVINLDDEMCQTMLFYVRRGLVLNNFSDSPKHLISLIFNELTHYSNNTNTQTVAHISGYIYDVTQYILTHYAEPLTLEHIASRFFISRAKLVTDFRIYTGMSVKEYIILVRMNIARNFLADGMSVSKCAAMCGYNSTINFSTTFKHIYDISPSDYKRHLKNK